MTVVAVDLGGTRLKAAELASDGGIDGELVTFEHEGDWRGGLQRVRERFDGIDEVALCVPGIVDAGRVLALPGKLRGIEGTDLGAELGVPVLVANDAIAYGVGEAVLGGGRGHDRVVVVTLGTGVGVAVIEDRVPLGRGPYGGGLLGGQIPVPGNGQQTSDTSGRAGTFEARCRASSLVAAVPGAADAPEAYARLRAGDPSALQGFAEYREWLVLGLTALALAHAPSAVVVGGGAAQPGLLEGVEEAMAPRLWQSQKVSVRLAELGDAAALAGLGVLRAARAST